MWICNICILVDSEKKEVLFWQKKQKIMYLDLNAYCILMSIKLVHKIYELQLGLGEK